ncbi:MAG TPA: hypothetical protein VGG74_34220 [Kofleriaceae bacterium]
MFALAIVACGGGGGFPDAPVMMPPQDPGTLALSWTLDDSMGSAVSCGSAGAAGVVVNIIQEGTGAQFGQTFACSLGLGVSGSLPTATYDLMFSLVDGSNAVLATGSAQTGISITPDNTTEAGNIVFVVTPI